MPTRLVLALLLGLLAPAAHAQTWILPARFHQLLGVVGAVRTPEPDASIAALETVWVNQVLPQFFAGTPGNGLPDPADGAYGWLAVNFYDRVAWAFFHDGRENGHLLETVVCAIAVGATDAFVTDPARRVDFRMAAAEMLDTALAHQTAAGYWKARMPRTPRRRPTCRASCSARSCSMTASSAMPASCRLSSAASDPRRCKACEPCAVETGVAVPRVDPKESGLLTTLKPWKWRTVMR